MPWKPGSAPRFTKKADTSSKKALWSEVANTVLKKTGDEGQAVREANAVIRGKKGKK